MVPEVLPKEHLLAKTKTQLPTIAQTLTKQYIPPQIHIVEIHKMKNDYSIEQLNKYTNDHAIDIIRNSPNNNHTFKLFPHLEYAKAWITDQTSTFVRKEYTRSIQPLTLDLTEHISDGEYAQYTRHCGAIHRLYHKDTNTTNHVLVGIPHENTPANRHEGGSFGYKEIPGLPLTEQYMTNAHELAHYAQFAFGILDPATKILPTKEQEYQNFKNECFADSYSIAHTIATNPQVAPKDVYNHILHMRVSHASFKDGGIDVEHHTIEALGPAARLGIDLRNKCITNTLDIATKVHHMVERSAEQWWQNVQSHDKLDIRDSIKRGDKIAQITEHAIDTAPIWTAEDNNAWIKKFREDNKEHMPILQRINTNSYLDSIAQLTEMMNPDAVTAIHPHALGAENFHWTTPKNATTLKEIIDNTGSSITDIRDGYQKLFDHIDDNPLNKRIRRKLDTISTLCSQATATEYMDNRDMRAKVTRKITLPTSTEPANAIVLYLPDNVNKTQRAISAAAKITETMKQQHITPDIYIIPNKNFVHHEHFDTQIIRKRGLSPLSTITEIPDERHIPTNKRIIVVKEGTPLAIKTTQELQKSTQPKQQQR